MSSAEDVFQVRLPLQATLCEGLHWDTRRACLWMVDIHGQRVMSWDTQSASWQSWASPQRVGWVIPADQGDTLIAGLQQGVARVSLSPSNTELVLEDWLVKPFEGQPALRLNDAKADRTGAIWAGSLNNDDESRSDGALYRLGPDGQWAVQDTGYLVANGPAIHPDGKLMLHTDSGRRTIYAFDLDMDAGRLDRKRVWRVFADDEGYPDGMTFDAEGCLWVAHWGAACISRFAPDGSLLRRITLPTSHITNVCFGGADLGRLFVSSARAGLSPQDLASQPLAGSLFEVDAGGVRGLSPYIASQSPLR